MRDSYALYTDQLQGEYAEVFKQIEKYVFAQDVDRDTVEAHMGDLLDIFLNAQKEGKIVEKIVGNDVEAFCKNFCSEFGLENRVMNVIDTWKNMAWCILGIELLDIVSRLLLVFSGEVAITDLWSAESSFNITGYLIGFIVISLIFTFWHQLTGKAMFKLRKGSIQAKLWTGVEIIVMIACFIILFSAQMNEKLNLLEIPKWVIVIASGAFLIGYYIVNRDRVRERRANRVSLWGIFKDAFKEARSDETEFLKNFEKEMEKIRTRKNKRLLKKGEKAMEQQEFLEWRKDHIKSGEKFKPIYDWAPVVLVILFGILGLKNGMMINLEFIGYLVVIFVLEFLFFKAIWKLVHKLVNYSIKQIEKLQKYLSEKEAEETI